MLSANKKGNTRFETLARSVTYKIKSKGPKLLPCGTRSTCN